MRFSSSHARLRRPVGSFLIASALLCLHSAAQISPQTLTAHGRAGVDGGRAQIIAALRSSQRTPLSLALLLRSEVPVQLAPPVFAPTSAIVTAGKSVNYNVVLPASISSVSVSCLGLPAGAECSYSASESKLRITTSPRSPRGRFLVTAAFAETETTTIAASLLLPAFVLPYLLIRRKLAVPGMRIGDFLCFAVVAFATIAACSGPAGSGSASAPLSATRTLTSSGAVALTIR